MNKKICLLFFALCIAAVYFACKIYISILQRNISPSSADLAVIIIDAGHGGADPGKPGQYQNEAEINLEIAKLLEKMLIDEGFFVIMTREDSDGVFSSGQTEWDKNDDMKERKSIIEKSNAEFFLSIHCNSFTDSACRGAQVFFPPGDTSSQNAAKTIQTCLAEISEVTNNRVAMEDANTRLINNNAMPSILAECGFLSNPQEEWLLSTPQYRERIAGALFKGICMYFGIEPHYGGQTASIRTFF